MSAVVADSLLNKYDVPAPRYTSYPTVPYWETAPSETQWLERLQHALSASDGRAAAMYLHIPFCRALCSFCGCNTRITRSHDFVPLYIQALLGELEVYLARLARSQLEIGELYVGGGTPTFLSTEELEGLLAGLFRHVRLRPDASATIEADPRVTTRAQLQLLVRHGIRGLSLGVQDFDPGVQQLVNRVQSEQQVREVTEAARELGFASVSFDLIYGLPQQSAESIRTTMAAVSRLRPDRIALYGYAHVPWIKAGQRRFTEADLPQAADRRALHELARALLTQAGYREIGLNLFALPDDALWQAQRRGTLHRNFMGYAPVATRPLIGLGVSAIGDAVDALAQNDKDLQRYQERVMRAELPIQRGHLLDAEDQVLRRHILRLTTHLETRWEAPAERTRWLEQAVRRLAEPEADGLVQLDAAGCRVTERGRPFLGNICMAFDARLARRLPERSLFERPM